MAPRTVNRTDGDDSRARREHAHAAARWDEVGLRADHGLRRGKLRGEVWQLDELVVHLEREDRVQRRVFLLRLQ